MDLSNIIFGILVFGVAALCLIGSACPSAPKEEKEMSRKEFESWAQDVLDNSEH